MCALLQGEKDKLALMYEGDKVRDATSKIRGFLFQDYLTINCLLNDGVECVCSEYLEDVDVFFANGKFEFIQVKYYPKTSPDMKEISTDLYYQYLRLQMLHSSLEATPKLCIHRTPQPDIPTLESMKTYLGLGNTLPQTSPVIQDPGRWLTDNVYSLKKKDEQKKVLFAKLASEDSLNAFRNIFTISKEDEITTYKTALLDALSRAYPNPDPNGNEEHWSLILLGLAISYIQRRYTLVDPDFDQLCVKKTEFDRHIRNSTQTKTNQTIAGYLAGNVSEVYEEVIQNNDLDELQNDMLGRIYRNTVPWIEQLGATEAGQYQLLNTVSKAEISKIASYPNADIDQKLICMAECSDAFHDFLKYLWKIMLNIGQERIKTPADISKHPTLFEPQQYIDPSVADYICLNFPDDKYARHAVILPPAHGGFKGVKRKIVERMVKMSSRPEKWFFENNKLATGKNYYNYSTADVNENPTVADLGRDSFYIECMDCIGIDEGDWSQAEICSTCIFSEKCVKEGK